MKGEGEKTETVARDAMNRQGGITDLRKGVLRKSVHKNGWLLACDHQVKDLLESAVPPGNRRQIAKGKE